MLQDVHFIFELLQNADDNGYEAGETPTLRFVLSDTDPTDSSNKEGCLIVLNNEKGFSAANVRALCNVAASTKKNRDGTALPADHYAPPFHSLTTTLPQVTSERRASVSR